MTLRGSSLLTMDRSGQVWHQACRPSNGQSDASATAPGCPKHWACGSALAWRLAVQLLQVVLAAHVDVVLLQPAQRPTQLKVCRDTAQHTAQGDAVRSQLQPAQGHMQLRAQGVVQEQGIARRTANYFCNLPLAVQITGNGLTQACASDRGVMQGARRGHACPRAACLLAHCQQLSMQPGSCGNARPAATAPQPGATTQTLATQPPGCWEPGSPPWSRPSATRSAHRGCTPALPGGRC